MHPHASRRDRTPRGPVPQSPNHNIAPPNAMLEIAASQPYTTVHPPRFNSFVPDAQMLFHVLGICDQLMLTTTQFLRSSPSWLPIVSQLYISLLWNFTILRNFSLASFNGRFFDITPIIPEFTSLWNASAFHINADYARQIPIPAIILDQLHHFATSDDTDSFQFQWYGNVFSQSIQEYEPHGPQLCGSLFSTPQQTASARAFWSSVFVGATRVNAAGETAPFTSILNLFGFENSQTNWFQYTCIVMHNYSKYDYGSVPLSSILPTELGAVAVRGAPSINEATRSFLYPTDAEIEPFTSSRFNPRRQIPLAMSVTFKHCENDGLGEEVERYAIVAHTNLRWPLENGDQNEWTRVNSCVTHRGDVWSLMCHRFSNPVVSLHLQLGQVLVSRYHLHELYLIY
ncbi:uncharacterized protein LOC125586201 [Brassica napus]|uniref:uncharacterized protein LOC106339079 n=1 Tax=Brassica oleracea var. oleracea TaxID=109376 RepID=UPI0006A71E50|nr:PREDICTED: uncharacterized protein LOC106339079 [Brassica oleracea var. oleracea]XP_048612000.1 uncharacterized protein LOC125586201 [Brassica napus]